MSIYKFINHSDSRISSLLKNIVKLHPLEIDLSLIRMRALLKKLGNPQNTIPYTVHVAGTNGKGSVATSIYYLQKLNGKKVHVYRSPHLISINERIIVANKMISDDLLYKYLRYVYEINNYDKITFFEFFTATAFLIFSKYKSDLLVCEVGLGGRYDATNVLNSKTKSCIITTIGLDHKDYLGSNLSKIAFEKAGILKSNNTFICSNQNKKALNILKQVACKKNCKSLFYGESWSIKNKSLIIENEKVNLSNLSLEGEHQLKNIGCAILACYKIKKLKIEKNKIEKFIGNIKWSGRLHKLKGSIKRQNPNTDFWVDCAHNPLGFNVIGKWVSKHEINNIILILALGINKDYKSILKEIRKMKPRVLLLPKITNFNNRKTLDIALIAKKLSIKCKVLNNTEDAISFACNLKQKIKSQNKICLIAGSINLIGEVLKKDKCKLHI